MGNFTFTNFSLLNKDLKLSKGYILEDARGMTPDGKKFLDVSIVSTHSGLLNLNTRFYIPSRMRDGVVSFTNKNKPVKILKNHEADEAFGVVLDAEYVETIPDQLMYNRDVQILNDSSYSIDDQVKAARNLIKDGIPFLDGWEGLGYIKLRARIIDEKTIEQIESGLFDSVSTSFSPNSIYCSVCGSQWHGMMDAMMGGGCGHIPGGIYPIPDEDGKEDDSKSEKVFCCLIPDYHDYHECSLVVFGADPITTIDINSDSKNSLFMQSDQITKLLSCNPSEFGGFVLSDIKEDNMGVKFEDTNTDNPQDTEDTKKFIFSYRDMLGCLDNTSALDVDKLEAELVSLPDSVFCGPDRTFPVPDELHCKAAVKYIENIEELEDKEEILQKVKDKAIVFDVKEEDTKQESVEEDKQCADCAELSEKLSLAEKELSRLNDHSRVLRKEWNDSYVEQRQLFDRYVQLKLDSEKHIADLCSVILVVNGDCVSVEDAKEKLASVENIIEAKEKLLSDFDITKITDKINSGIEKEPESKIESPLDSDDIDDSVIEENTDTDESWKDKQIVKMALQQIDNMLDRGEESEARKYFELTRKYNFFPEDLNFESLVKK